MWTERPWRWVAAEGRTVSTSPARCTTQMAYGTGNGTSSARRYRHADSATIKSAQPLALETAIEHGHDAAVADRRVADDLRRPHAEAQRHQRPRLNVHRVSLAAWMTASPILRALGPGYLEAGAS